MANRPIQDGIVAEPSARYAEELLTAARASSWSSEYWSDFLMRKMLRSEAFRVQVLRFVDVMPALADDRDLIKHLREYFASPEINLPWMLRWLLLNADRYPAPVAAIVRKSLLTVSHRFIGGKDFAEALDTVHHLRKRNLGFSLDLLGEQVVSEAEADRYQQGTMRLIEELAPELNQSSLIPLLDQISGSPGPKLYVSLKLTALYSQVGAVNFADSVRRISVRLRPIFECAQRNRAFVCIDMEQYETKAIVLETFKQILTEDRFRDWSDVGIALQAYLKETRQDIEELIQWAKQRGTPVTVRLVRGAYWDYETVIADQSGWDPPVWRRKWDTDHCYQQCLTALLGNHSLIRTAVATHNAHSLAYAMVLAEEMQLDSDQFEFQMLYGMAAGLQRAIADKGFCLRIYVPFGEPIPGMAYLVRRLLENSSSQTIAFPGASVTQAAKSPRISPEVSPPLDRAVNDQEPHLNLQNPAAEFPDFQNEPRYRFSSPDERIQFQLAIDALRQRLGKRYPMRLNGRYVETATLLKSVNPANSEEAVGWVNTADTEHIGQAVRGAVKTLGDWSGTSVLERAKLLIRSAGLLRQRRNEFAALEILEAGKTWCEADANVTEAIDFLEYYAREAIRLESVHTFDVPGESNLFRISPLGVGVVIPPWNFPLAILAGMLSAAIVTGNTVILKPSSQTPVIAAHLVDLLAQAGIPDGVVQFLPGTGEIVGRALVEHDDVQFVAFTGSESVGSSLLSSASKQDPGRRQFKRVIAEMGGKNAIIVDGDAELDDAIAGIVGSAFGYQGQKCSACSRLIVIGKHYPYLLSRLKDATRSLNIGNPADPTVDFGPVIELAALKRIKEAIQTGKQVAHLELEIDCSAHAKGYFVGPAIFSEVPTSSALFREEIFGPVLSVLQADSVQHALSLANDSRYALTGGFYSRSPAHIEQVKREFEVGNLYINRGTTGALVRRQPFGGFRMSGVGRKAGGPDYLLQFTNQRTITENTMRRGFAPL